MSILRESYLNHVTVNEVLNMVNSMPEDTDFEYVVKGGKIYYECCNIRSESNDSGLHDSVQGF